MNTRDMARALGRRGGRARARNLTADERRRIAALGGAARRRSLEAGERLTANFVYAAIVRELQGLPVGQGTTDVDEVAHLTSGLQRLGLEPVLIGGMALVLLGSRRVTQDFDFVIRHPGELIDQVADLFYSRGLVLVSKLNAAGEVTATIGNRRGAANRLRLDAPASAVFFNRSTMLRVDLLFDYPVTAAELAASAVETKIRGRVLNVASAADLLRLKEIAAKQRSAAGDAQDVEFLRAHLRG
jgi:hypothetical protein